MTLPSDIQFLLDQESESEVIYRYCVYLKVYNNDKYISLYKTDTFDYLKEGLELVLVYSVKAKKPLIFFKTEFGINRNDERYYTNLVKKVNNLLSLEFNDLSTFISVNPKLLLNPELINRAKEQFLANEEPTFEVPFSIELRDLNLNDLIEIAEDSNEFAYNFVEQYINDNSTLINQYQEFLAIKELLLNYETTFSQKVLIQKQLQEIQDEHYKTLQIVVELGDGTLSYEKIVTSSYKQFYAIYPFYSIVKVLHGRKILYERNIDNLLECQLSEELNVQELSEIKKYLVWNYPISSHSINFQKALTCINLELWDSEVFVFEVCKDSKLYLKNASTRLKSDNKFIDSLLKEAEKCN